MQESLLMIPSLEEPTESVEFLGEVSASGFITGDALASAIGLTAGTAQHTDEPWLKFELDGKTLYVAKKPYRYNLSWNSIHARGAVFGTRTVVINGLTYKVRLLRGADVDPTPAPSGYNPVGTSASEWDRLIYNVHNGVHTRANNTTPPGHWPLYSDVDLVVHNTGGKGSRSWCQETRVTATGQRVRRGGLGVSYVDFVSASTAVSDHGWRPVLELVP